MSAFPSLPLFTDAWVADTKHLSRLERGTYHDLLILMWRTPECRVPDDNAWLARRMNMTIAEVESELRPIIVEFCICEDEKWITQKRLRREYIWCSEKSKRNGAAAKARWNKEKASSERNTKTTPRRNAPNLSSPTTSSLSSLEATLNLEEPQEEQASGRWSFDDFWKLYPHKVGKDDAKRSFDRVRKSKMVDFAALMAGLLRYSAKTDDRPWCNPATWLNQGRWSDQPATVARAPPKSASTNGAASFLAKHYAQENVHVRQDPNDHTGPEIDGTTNPTDGDRATAARR